LPSARSLNGQLATLTIPTDLLLSVFSSSSIEDSQNPTGPQQVLMQVLLALLRSPLQGRRPGPLQLEDDPKSLSSQA